jgi:hypothetical protein
MKGMRRGVNLQQYFRSIVVLSSGKVHIQGLTVGWWGFWERSAGDGVAILELVFLFLAV